MNLPRMPALAVFVMAWRAFPASALDRPDVTLKVFLLPADIIPHIDGNTDDYAMVPDGYAICMDQFVDR